MKKTLVKSLSLFLCLALLTSSVLFASFASDNGLEPRRITVSVNGDTSVSRGFCWYTDDKTGSEVRIFYDGADVSGSLTFSDVTCSEWQGSYMHKVTVSGLTPGKTYTYKVGYEVWSSDGSFTTDDGDDKVNFINISDVQAGSLDSFLKGRATLDAAYKTMPDADFYSNCGDFTNDSTNEEWDYYHEAFQSLNMTATTAPVAGNHDGFGAEGWFSNMFNLDTSESVQNNNGVNYSFDYGNAHFAVLNTNDLASVSLSQLKWLKNDMNGTSKDWKIVLMHKSPYSLGKDGKWPDALYLQESLVAVLDRCGVDLVISGHDHQYLRTKTLYNNRVSENGTVYVLAGTAGTKRYEVRSFLEGTFIDKNQIAALVVQKNGYGNYWNGTDWNSTKDTNVGGAFSCISIDGGTLTFNAYILADQKDESDGDVITNIDSFTITKETGKNSATFNGDNKTSRTEYYLNIVPSVICLAGYAFGLWLPKFLFMLPKLISVYINDGIF